MVAPTGPFVTLGSHHEVRRTQGSTCGVPPSPQRAVRGTAQSCSCGRLVGDLDGFLSSTKRLSGCQVGVTCV